MPDGGGLIEPQPARRALRARRVLRPVTQLRLKQRAVCAQAARGQLTGSRGAPCACAWAVSCSSAESCAAVAYRAVPGRV